jgi:hypothetical protein
MVRILNGHLKRDRAAERNTHDGGALEAKLVNQPGKVIRMLGDIMDQPIVSMAGLPGVAIITKSISNDVKVAGKPFGERERQLPASRHSGNEDERITFTEMENIEDRAPDLHDLTMNFGIFRAHEIPGCLPLRC